MNVSVQNPPPKKDSQSYKSFGSWADGLFEWVTRLFSVGVSLSLVSILLVLFVSALPSIKAFGWSFLWTNEWDPVQDKFGALIPIYGTVVTSMIALLIAVPISFGIAVFLTEMAPSWLMRPLGIAIELLAAIPSIIYGMWGLFVFSPFFSHAVQPLLTKTFGNIPEIGRLFQGPPMGIGILTAGIILAIMIIPFISSVMRDVFFLVPPVLKESAYGLGATTTEVMWRVVLPYTRSGVVGGVMLGLGRALGETMAVTFVIGNATRLGGSLYSPGSSIPSTLANEFAEAVGDLYTSSLIELGLILFLITTFVLAIAKLLLLRLGRLEGEKS